MNSRVSEIEKVRDFCAWTKIVLVVDLAFLFLFIAMIAIFAGWLAIVPLAIISAMIVAGFFLQRRMTVAALENQRSEEHTSELQSLMRISYAVFCLKKKKKK